MDLLHLIPALGPGGPTRSLLTFVKQTKHSHPDVRHTVASLQAREYMPLAFDLRRQGAEIVRAAKTEAIIAQVERADVVLVHFWNTPQLWRTLTSSLPPSRYVLWSHVLGAHPPQRLNARLLASAARVVLNAPLPAYLAAQNARARVILCMVDNERLQGYAAKPHDGFHADYIGTTNKGKMHPRFVAMMAALDIPDLTVRICGGALEPGMAAEISQARQPERFECRGFVENISSVLETSDVFAYPLAENTYAAACLSLQEAMLAGVPPVILPHGGPSRFVTSGKNGIVAQSEDEFVAAITYLYRHPDKRAELGRGARQSAEILFSADKHTADLVEVLAEAAREPKRCLLMESEQSDPPLCAAGLFLMSQNWDEVAAATAVAAWRAGDTSELLAYGADLSDDAFQVEGGILHWRNEALDDPLLRWWTALWLARQGRVDDARQEIFEAARHGPPVDALVRQTGIET